MLGLFAFHVVLIPKDQTGFFIPGTATSLGEGKISIQTYLKNNLTLCHTLIMVEGSEE